MAGKKKINMIKEVELAIKHVQKYHSDVEIMCINQQGLWQFFTENWDAPIFDARIDINVIQAAADSVLETPFIYQL